MKIAAGLFAALVCSVAVASGSSPRTLSFNERVKAQEAIERVYYTHRIGATETFEQAMPRADLEGKVRKYLAQSDALMLRGNPAVTDGMLQSELDRMASGTKMPDRLRELYAALGNDTFLIKECLVRPILVDRLTRGPRAFQRTLDQEKLERKLARSITGPRGRRFGSPGALSSATASMRTLKGLAPAPYGSICPTVDAWAPTSSLDAPPLRELHTAVWTGTEMIVWGGHYFDGATDFVTSSGALYDPVTDSWSPTSTTGAPAARAFHTAVWTGTRMVVWGGLGVAGFLGSGGSYNPATDTWVPTSMTGAPSGRINHTAVWTGTQMIVWGGLFQDSANHELGTGGRYNPVTNVWAATSTGANAPSARELHVAVWTGSRMVVWGGYNGTDFVDTGGRYDPVSNAWTTTSTTDAPPSVELHSAVWTGSRMVVWGGWDGFEDVDTGGLYDPTSDSWTPTSTTGASSPRDSHTAVWTGARMLVWGGAFGANFLPLDTGDAYDPATDTWTPLVQTGAPEARYYHTAVWADTQMVVWGGEDGSVFFDTGGSYTPFENDGDGMSACQGDCDDFDPAVHPGATEICNNKDDDCDTVVDNGGNALCDDANACTDDVCNDAAGCANVDTSAACTDGLVCTADACEPAAGCSTIHKTINIDIGSFSADRVDGRDLAALADAWNSCAPDVRYSAAADLDPTSTPPGACVDEADFHLFMNAFGRSCP